MNQDWNDYMREYRKRNRDKLARYSREYMRAWRKKREQEKAKKEKVG